MSIITDGTGSGYRAGVNSRNELAVASVSQSIYERAAEDGRAFNLNTEVVAYSGTGPYVADCLYVKNNETTDVEVVGWFIGEANNRAGGDTSSALLFEMYGNPTGTPTGAAATIVNRRIGAPRQFLMDALSDVSGLSVTGSPLLYQYHYSGRGFGTVNFTIPAGQSIVIKCNIPCNTLSFYTGFTGYVRAD